MIIAQIGNYFNGLNDFNSFNGLIRFDNFHHLNCFNHLNNFGDFHNLNYFIYFKHVDNSRFICFNITLVISINSHVLLKLTKLTLIEIAWWTRKIERKIDPVSFLQFQQICSIWLDFVLIFKTYFLST